MRASLPSIRTESASQRAHHSFHPSVACVGPLKDHPTQHVSCQCHPRRPVRSMSTPSFLRPLPFLSSPIPQPPRFLRSWPPLLTLFPCPVVKADSDAAQAHPRSARREPALVLPRSRFIRIRVRVRVRIEPCTLPGGSCRAHLFFKCKCK